MPPDIVLVAGLLLALVSIPAILSAWADRRLPVLALGLLILAAAALWHAHASKPGGYALHEVPLAIYAVIGMLLH